MANYSYKIFAVDDGFKEDYSMFTVRIEPPIFPLPEIFVENNIFTGMDIKHYATTQSASVYRIDHNEKDLTHEVRTMDTVAFLSRLVKMLNGIENNDATIWAEDEIRVVNKIIEE